MNINGATSRTYTLNNVSGDDNGTYRVLVTTPSGTATSSGANLTVSLPTTLAQFTNGLVAYYPFNGNANDESGNGHNGTVQGPTLTTDRNGAASKAYTFDGTNDQIHVQNTTGIPAGAANRTWSAWFKTSWGQAQPKNRDIIAMGTNSGTQSIGIVITEAG